MDFIRVTTHEEICEVMKKCADFFFDQKYNDELIIDKLSKKFSENAKVIVCLEDKNVLGFVSYYCNNYEARLAFVSMIIVVGKATGKGVGSKLMEQVCVDAKESGMLGVELEVSKENHRAISFYKKLNFLEKEMRQNSLILSKEL